MATASKKTAAGKKKMDDKKKVAASKKETAWSDTPRIRKMNPVAAVPTAWWAISTAAQTEP